MASHGPSDIHKQVCSSDFCLFAHSSSFWCFILFPQAVYCWSPQFFLERRPALSRWWCSFVSHGGVRRSGCLPISFSLAIHLSSFGMYALGSGTLEPFVSHYVSAVPHSVSHFVFLVPTRGRGGIITSPPSPCMCRVPAGSWEPWNLVVFVFHISRNFQLSKEVWKSNFRQYGQMKSRDGKSQRREEKRREEERRSEKRKSQKKEDPGARKGRKVVKHCVFPMICGSGGSKSRLAKAAGAEPAGQIRD